jgi:hypothetical protein
MRIYDKWLDAVTHESMMLQRVPEEFRDYAMCIAAVANYGVS